MTREDGRIGPHVLLLLPPVIPAREPGSISISLSCGETRQSINVLVRSPPFEKGGQRGFSKLVPSFSQELTAESCQLFYVSSRYSCRFVNRLEIKCRIGINTI
jgi:hypothetical protein